MMFILNGVETSGEVISKGQWVGINNPTWRTDAKQNIWLAYNFLKNHVCFVYRGCEAMENLQTEIIFGNKFRHGICSNKTIQPYPTHPKSVWKTSNANQFWDILGEWVAVGSCRWRGSEVQDGPRWSKQSVWVVKQDPSNFRISMISPGSKTTRDGYFYKDTKGMIKVSCERQEQLFELFWCNLLSVPRANHPGPALTSAMVYQQTELIERLGQTHCDWLCFLTWTWLIPLGLFVVGVTPLFGRIVKYDSVRFYASLDDSWIFTSP